MKEFISYISSKLFLKNAGIALGSVLVSLIILLLFLRFYTHHNQKITVPDFSEIPLESVKEQLTERNLRYEIFDSLFVADSKPGIIIEQHPKGGSIVKKNRKVYLTINAKSPEKIIMPNLRGITLREARTKITVAGFELGKLRYRYDMAKNVVLEQQLKGETIEPGDTILKGSTIDLVLGKGLSNERKMAPDLIGLSYELAIIKASDSYFTLSEPIPDIEIEENDTLVPFIYRQHPEHKPNILVPLGTQITLWVTIDSTKLPGFTPYDSTLVWDKLNHINNADNSEEDPYDYESTF